MSFKSFETSYLDLIWHELSESVAKIVKKCVSLEIIKNFIFSTQKWIEFFEGVPEYPGTSNLHNFFIYVWNTIPESFK